jgi:hypothetical protein
MTVHVLLSGGAVLDDGGIPIWFPSRREALDELEARRPRPTIDYPYASTPDAKTAGVNA